MSGGRLLTWACCKASLQCCCPALPQQRCSGVQTLWHSRYCWWVELNAIYWAKLQLHLIVLLVALHIGSQVPR